MSYQTSPNTVSMPQSGDILLGRYVIEGTISKGGFSTVYRGRQLGVDRTVAIKCLDPESVRLDPAAPQRFAREARMASTAGAIFGSSVITVRSTLPNP